jgi:5S rRNA maturation endonuclease (ribonuclease M5)
LWEFCGPGPESSSDKKHLWVNSETGLWQDFKTGKKGNFIQLISYLNKTSISNAKSTLMRKAFSAFHIKVEKKQTQKSQEKKYKFLDFKEILQIEKVTYDKLDYPNYRNVKSFLEGRKIIDTIEDFPLYLSTGDPYPNRLIIPFLDELDRMYFFQGRALDKNSKAKYITPSKTYGVKSSNTLYPFDKDRDLVIVEGPLKARLLQHLGINATSIQGSKLSFMQATIIARSIKKEKVILSFDNDDAGRRGEQTAQGMLVKKLGVDPKRVYSWHSSPLFNDWEDAWIAGEDIKRSYSDDLKNMGKLEHLIDRLLN